MKRRELGDAKTPFAAASGTAVPRDWREPKSTEPAQPLTLQVSASDSRKNGDVLLGRFRELVKAMRRGRGSDEKSVRDLRRLVASTGTLMLHVPEFLEYMAELLAKDRRKAVAHVLGGVQRGAPLQLNEYLVAMVDLVRRQGARSVAAACDKLRKIPGGPFEHLSVERMAIAYGEQQEVLHAARSFSISERDLAEVPPDLREELLGTLRKR